MFLAKPDAPSAPRPKKVGKKFVELAWDAPLNDGNSKVTGYIVEKRQSPTDSWSRVNNFPVPDTEWVIPDLVENASYEFRIIAVNKAGESEPSLSSGSIKVSEYPSKCLSKHIFMKTFKL